MASDWWMLLASLVLIAATLVSLWWHRYATKFSRAGLPQMPPLPVVGNMLDVVLNRKAMSDIVVDVYKHFEPHPYAGFYTFAKSLVLVKDPDLIRSVTVKDFDHFTDHVDFMNTGKAHPLQQRMLLFMKGREWHEMRTTLSPAFTSMKMRSMFTLITEIGQQIVDYIKKECAKIEVSSGEEQVLTLEMKDFFTRVTNDVIATTAFGVKVDSLAEPNNTFYSMGRELTTIKSATVIGYMLVPRLMQLLGAQFPNEKVVDFFRTMLTETMKTREEKGIVRHDMVHLMMQARRGELAPEEAEDNGATGGKRRHLTDDDITAQALIFFFAGFDTVSTLLTFSSFLLATHQGVQQRLQKEVDDVMQKSGGQPSYEQVLGCQYLDMVLSAQRFALMEAKVVLVYLLSKFSFQVVDKTPVPLKLQTDSATLSVQGGAWLGIRIRV